MKNIPHIRHLIQHKIHVFINKGKSLIHYSYLYLFNICTFYHLATSCTWKSPWFSGLTKDSLILLHQEVWISIHGKDELCRILEKKFTRDLRHGARNIVKNGSHRTAQVMQSDENPYNAVRIVGCSIGSVTFPIVCNSIINQC